MSAPSRTARRTELVVVLLVLPLTALVAGALPARAAAEPTPSARPDDDPAAVLLLRRAAAAAAGLSWSGTEFVSAWSAAGTVSTVVDVRHVPGQGTVAQAHGGATAAPAFSRDEPGGSRGSGLLVDGAVDRLLAAYSLVVLGTDRVGGRTAAIVGARRIDGRLAARLWVDRATGLPLRREVLDAEGQVVRASAFVDLRVGGGGFLGHLPPSAPSAALAWTSAPTAEPAVDDVVRLRAGGWSVPPALAGLPLDHAAVLDQDGADVLHLRFCDGLSTVSVFEQRGRLDLDPAMGLIPWRPAGSDGATVHRRPGLPLRVTWEAGGTVFTVVADAPDEVVARVVAGLPHDEPAATAVAAGRGVDDRLRRGASRLAGWLNPFD